MIELLDLRHGLTTAKSNNFDHFSIEVDSSVILQMLANDHSFYHNILTEYRSLIEETQPASPAKIFREQNAVADMLSKEGTKSQVMVSPKLLWQMPLFVSGCLKTDCNESLTQRRIKSSFIILQDQDAAPNNLFLALSHIRSTIPFPP